MKLVAKESGTEKLLRRIAPQGIIVLTIIVLMSVGAVIFQKIDPELEKQTFYEVIFFEFITISTIGYGNQYPQTHLSRAFSIIFSIFGIPLLIVTLGNFGKYLTKFYWKFHGFVKNKEAKREFANDTDMPILALFLLYALTFAVGFVNFDFPKVTASFDEFYLSYISFTTVGFGDQIPSIDCFSNFCKVTIYLLWGMVLNIMAISCIANLLSSAFKKVFKAIKNAFSVRPFRGRDVEVMINGNCITVSEITSLVAKEFHATPREVRSMLHEIDSMMENLQEKKEEEEQEENKVEEDSGVSGVGVEEVEQEENVLNV